MPRKPINRFDLPFNLTKIKYPANISETIVLNDLSVKNQGIF